LTPANLRQAVLDYLDRFVASTKRLDQVIKRKIRVSTTAHGDDPAPLLALLREIGYAERDGHGRWRLTVPVFDAADRPMLEKTLALSRSVLRAWLAAREPELRREMSGLTAIRAGLSFEEIFTQVWHEIFGATTRALARDGMIASAYGGKARSKGSFSALWRQRLYAFVPG